jgi:hypothetical protein
MNENKFIITSTVATDFGTGDRLHETLMTIQSIRKRLDAKIYLIDSSVHDWDENPVREAVDTFLRVSDTHTRNIIESGYGMPFVKSATEVYLMQIALDLIGYSGGVVYKISGRYRLNDNFTEHKGQKFRFLKPMPTGIPFEKCKTDGMLMTRLYSFPGEFRTYFSNVLVQVNRYLWKTYSSGGLTDIEHGLYEHLPHDLCNFVETIGVEGRIGHLTTEVRE